MSRVRLAIAAALAVALLVWVLALLDRQPPLGPERPGEGPVRETDAPPPAPLPPRNAEDGSARAPAVAPGSPDGPGTGPVGAGNGAAASGGDRPSLAEPKDPGPPWPEALSSGIVVVELAGELAGAELAAMVFPAEKKDEVPPVAARVLEDGRVMLPPLAEGDWRLEVAAEKGGRVVREQRKLTVGKGPVSMDPIRVVPEAGIRARVVDADGAWIPQAIVVVVREDEDPERARRLKPGGQGWVLYGDLEPSNYHRVVALGMPTRLEETVRTPNREGAYVEVELKADDRLVFCRMTLRPPEGAPAGGLSVAAPIVAELRPDDRELQGQLLPGAYEIEATIRGHPGRLTGKLFVPAGGPFEGAVDLVVEE